MITAIWASTKSSPMMAEIRQALKKKSGKGEPPISNKEANLYKKIWFICLNNPRSIVGDLILPEDKISRGILD
jgi:hypothetical protein